MPRHIIIEQLVDVGLPQESKGEPCDVRGRAVGAGMDSVAYLRASRMDKKRLALGGTPLPLQAWNIPPSKPKRSNVLPSCSWIVNPMHDFTQNSSLHGLRYIGDTNLHIVERLFWFGSFCLAVLTAAYFISNLYQKWQRSPVILSLSPTPTSLTAIPFPAVTICSMNNVKKSSAEWIKSSSLEQVADIERKLLNDLCQDDPNVADASLDNITIKWKTIQSFMVNVSQPCHEMILGCYWHGEPLPCSDLFNPALTDEGICCSFNKLKRDFIFRNPRDLSDLNVTFPYESVDWSPESGYPSTARIEYLPWRPWGAGSHLGLTIILDANLDEYYCSSEISIGFKYLLHNPVETPKMSAFGSMITPGSELRIVITPRIMTATEKLRSIPLKKRQCLFNDERNLRFYRTYTERNCALECEANFTLDFCKCVLYFMPKDADTRICGRKDLECANLARKVMELRLTDASANISTTFNLTNRPACGCLPGCFAVDYTSSLTTSKLTDKIGKSKLEFLAGKTPQYFKKNMAVVNFFFVNTQFTANQRGELFGFTEFLSNTGGLLGLFMGFSFLSAVEAFYFITLRLWCSIGRRSEIKNISAIAPQNMPLKPPFPFAR